MLDASVISELRKGQRADAKVTAWFADVAEEEIFLSALTIGEIRRGDRECATSRSGLVHDAISASIKHHD